MIKIARLISYFSGQYGGPVNHILELTKHLEKYPIHTTVYACSEIDYSRKKKTFSNQIINPRFIIKRNNSYIRFKEYRVALGFVPLLMKNIKNIDIFHSHAFRSFHEDIATLFSLIKKKKLIITPHGALCTILNYYDYLFKRFYDITDTAIKNKFLDINYIAVSKTEIEFLEKYGLPKSRIHYIPHGIDYKHFKPLDTTNILKKYNLSNLKTKKIILYVGRIDIRKGINILINAFLQLKNEFPDAYLLIVGGDSGYKSVIERLTKKHNIQNRVIFLGFIPKQDLPEIYSLANIVVYPSKYEIFGHVILEANACEKIVIASNHWGPKELIINGKNGFLIRYGDIEELKDKIAYALENENKIVNLGKLAREHVKRNYSWELNAESHYNLYRQLLE